MVSDNNKHEKRRISDIIDLHKLEHESRRYLLAGFLFAILLCCMLGVFVRFERIDVDIVEYKSMPVELVDISKRMSKPLEIGSRRYRPKKLVRKRSGARMPDGNIASRQLEPLDAGESPGMEDFDTDNYSADSMIPDRIEQIPHDRYLSDTSKIDRVPENHLYMTDEFISIDGLDTGEYMGLIVNDPGDPHNIRGYIHIPSQIHGVSLVPCNTAGYLNDLKDIVLKNYTGVEVKLDAPLYLDSSKIHNYPFLYITAGKPFDLTRSETENLKKYLENGGFVLMEPLGPPDWVCGMSHGTASMRQMIRDTFLSGARLELLSPEHELFHCFFDITLHEGFNAYPIVNYECYWKQLPDFLEGLFIGDRLVLVYSEKGYGTGWHGNGLVTAQKMGVNCLVYALRQHGGLTRKMVDVSTNTIQTSRRWWDIESRMKYRDTEKSSINPNYKHKTNTD